MTATKACPSCGSDIPGASRFCPQCGTPQALSCAACGHANAAGSRFCAQCGAKIGDAAAVPAALATPAAAAPAPPAAAAARAGGAAERRQLTVMFCDLVGSTALSTQLDPEDLREVIAAYHKCAADVITRSGGYVAKYMGDGVLVYFGYPEAHEADAENAVRAGLELVEAIKHLFRDEGRHQVRIGIATGLVVVGELVGAGEAQERNVVGETPNLAARLQSSAEPNTVIIAGTTRRLAGDLFEYESIEPATLKGFQEPVAAWRVLRERSIASRFEALRAASLTPLIGREEELQLLTRRWEQIGTGEGRVVLIAGEAGIGKSRLIAALEDQVKNDAHASLHYFCQPHHQGSALQPIVAQLQHAAHFTANDTAAEKRKKLDALVAQEAGKGADVAGLFAELLGLAQGPASETAEPQRRRRRLLEALLTQLENLARRGPVLMLFEDAHWADPTSTELLSLAIERLEKLPILLVITFRPDYQPPWARHSYVTMLTLNRLSARERAALVAHVTGGIALPAALLDQIVERTDGVPLFVEELTKSLLESQQLRRTGDEYVLDQPAQPLAIPTTLQDSLMARVDRLGSAREVLQIGGAIGREFSYEVLAQVAGLPDAVLQDALARLTEAELVFMRGSPPSAVYTFKHALIQDTAYSTMLRARRQQLHSAIALVLEKRHPDVVATTPEVLAQHFEQAGQSEKAIAYWHRAGERDLRRFAMKESIAHLATALRLVLAMPQSQRRDELELPVRLGLGVAQIVAGGPTSAEAAEHYRHARALAGTLPDRSRERFLATWGLWFNASVSGRPEGPTMADDLVAIATQLDNPDLLLEAHHAKVPMLLRAADLAGLDKAAKQVIKLYDRKRHRDHAFYFGGHDSRMCARSFYAQSLWAQGFLDQAADMSRQSIADARELGHILSQAHAMQRGGMTMMLLQDYEAARAIADELYALAERNKFAWQLADAIYFRGWLAALAGDFAVGLEQMTYAVNQPYNPGFRLHFVMHLAEQALRAGQVDSSATWVEKASDEIRIHGNHFGEPDVIRLRGEILLARSRDNHVAAEQEFREAMALAARQSFRSLQLRAATSLARLLAENNRRHEAREELAPVYAGFSEGFERPVLQSAKTLLDDLS
jgi:class 3 adenylate cyclase